MLQELLRALDANSFSEQTVDEIWRVTSAVLLLGNVKMPGKQPNDYVEEFDAQNKEIIKEVSELLQCDADLLEFSLKTYYQRMPKRAPAACPFQRRQAEQARDALARTLYNDMFESIVEIFSNRLKPETESKDTYMGVLDIFGFEFVHKDALVPGSVVNSFEQFCINLCNEKLQNHFVGCVFNTEILNYRSEGLNITTDDFDFLPNDQTVDLLQGRARDSSVLQILDQDSQNKLQSGVKGDDEFQTHLERRFNETKNLDD